MLVPETLFGPTELHPTVLFPLDTRVRSLPVHTRTVQSPCGWTSEVKRSVGRFPQDSTHAAATQVQ
jgi:hypothetical protein